MWTIREEQADAFRQYHLRKFEDEMVEHLQKFAPRHWKVIGETTGRNVIRLGIEQARKYGFTNRGPVRFYIELMFTFGSYFDTDPQYPWVTEILIDPRPMDQMARADGLFQGLNDYSSRVTGTKQKYFVQALRRLTDIQIDKVAKPGIALEQSAIEALRVAYPQAYDYLGELRAKEIILQGFEAARKHDLNSTKGMLLFAALTFFVGHGFWRDPLYSWISRRLDAPREPQPNKRADELYLKAILYMHRVLNSETA